MRRKKGKVSALEDFKRKIPHLKEQALNCRTGMDDHTKPKRNAMGSDYDLLIRYAYEYAVMWIEHEKRTIEDMIGDAIKEGKISQERKSYSPFSLSIRILSEPNKTTHLDIKKRSKYATGMEYAYRHAIEPQLVTAFINSVGGYDTINKKMGNKKLGIKKHREYWLEESIFKKQRKKLKRFMKASS